MPNLPCQAGVRRAIRIVAAGLGGLGLVAGLATVQAAPFRPAEDTEVLERLPASGDADARKLAGLRTALAASPDDLALALDVARRFIARGRASADPRNYGYAEAALRPWWDDKNPPVEVLVLRAVVHQSRHAFDPALDDLSRVLMRQPNHAQALLTQSFVLQVQGRYGEAERSCRRLPRAVDTLIVAVCAGRIASLTGRAETGYDFMRRALADAPRAEPAVRLWALTNLAEIAARLGKTEAAERHFQDAFALGRRDAYLLGAYADFLLEQGFAEEARALLRDETPVDALLLRLAIAEARLGLDSASQRRADLEARFEASRRRGSQIHRREEARFNLDVLHRPGAALDLAEANWAVQKEPQDAELVLRAALAAGEVRRAQPVAAWLRKVGLEGVFIGALIQRVEREAS